MLRASIALLEHVDSCSESIELALLEHVDSCSDTMTPKANGKHKRTKNQKSFSRQKQKVDTVNSFQ